MRAVVTGGSGFVGSHLLDALVGRGDEVVLLDRSTGGRSDDLRYIEGHEWLEGVDVVFHTAAISRTLEAIDDPVLCWETNLSGTVSLLEAARKAKVPRVVLSSSNIVYAAETPYRASKLAMEGAARVYTNLYGLSTVCLRYGNVYGPGQSEEGEAPNVLASFRRSLRKKGHIELSGDGEQTRDFIHVSDVVRANLLAAQSEVAGEYDICTGRNVSLLEVARMIGAEVLHTDEREGDVKHIIQDPLRAYKDLHFAPSVSLEDGIWDSFPRKVQPLAHRAAILKGT